MPPLPHSQQIQLATTFARNAVATLRLDYPRSETSPWHKCWSNNYPTNNMWRALHHLNLGVFCVPDEEPGEHDDRDGVRAMVLQEGTDWEAVQNQILSKTLSCLSLLRRGNPSKEMPEYFCGCCKEFSWFELNADNLCACAKKPTRWCSLSSPYKDAQLCYRLSEIHCGGLSWRQIRNFLPLWANWYSSVTVGTWMRMVRLQGTELAYAVRTREQACLILGRTNDTLQDRALARSIQVNTPATKRVLTGSSLEEGLLEKLILDQLDVH
jgi:hypothetical protein